MQIPVVNDVIVVPDLTIDIQGPILVWNTDVAPDIGGIDQIVATKIQAKHCIQLMDLLLYLLWDRLPVEFIGRAVVFPIRSLAATVGGFALVENEIAGKIDMCPDRNLNESHLENAAGVPETAGALRQKGPCFA